MDSRLRGNDGWVRELGHLNCDFAAAREFLTMAREFLTMAREFLTNRCNGGAVDSRLRGNDGWVRELGHLNCDFAAAREFLTMAREFLTIRCNSLVQCTQV